ncbi:YARHG domain-containing protein [uncultured Thiodictyon sp.]|uniref:YARHG domain-containing protein n=1 Tax=uncultured Thiodictyon sp. TaxID=1846217 RepID=UPI0025E0058E|nr:YARHG domain-containing protein [uncultured Thiodictyon sp.]
MVALHGWPLASSLAAEKGIKLPCPDAATITGGDPAADVTPDPEADALLHALDSADLVFCRNLPYARHGYRFARPALRAVFDREVAVPADEDGPSHRRFRFGAANPFYCDALLDSIDRR